MELNTVTDSYASSDDAAVAGAGVWAGAEVVCTMYGQRLNRADKDVGNVATAVDVEAEKLILRVIRVARVEDAVLGKEGEQESTADAGRQWLVDRLCGTLSYAGTNRRARVMTCSHQALQTSARLVRAQGWRGGDCALPVAGCLGNGA